MSISAHLHTQRAFIQFDMYGCVRHMHDISQLKLFGTNVAAPDGDQAIHRVTMPTKTVATGICRFDFDDRKVHGFMVRIMRRDTMHQELFSDNRYGGKRKARQASDDRIAGLRRELPDPVEQKGMLAQRNSTGKVGVHHRA